MTEPTGTRPRRLTARTVLASAAIVGIPLLWIAAPIVGITSVHRGWWEIEDGTDLRPFSVVYLLGMMVWWAIGIIATPLLASVSTSLIRGPMDGRRAGMLALGLYGAFTIYATVLLIVWLP